MTAVPAPVRLPGDTQIAGKKTVDQWDALRAELESNPTQALWEEAYDKFFHARLDHRYFKPIEALEKQARREGEGFSIVAIQCSLIEFLEATREGEIFKRKNPDRNLGEYNVSSVVFKRFLTQREPFKSEFAEGTWADDFYSDVRCGLLHEAGTRGGWRIHVDRANPGIFDKGTKIIYRRKLQEALTEYLKSYRAELLIDPASPNTGRQKAFIHKMNRLCFE
jgi:hypothetical protein